mgnify:FL=1
MTPAEIIASVPNIKWFKRLSILYDKPISGKGILEPQWTCMEAFYQFKRFPRKLKKQINYVAKRTRRKSN